MLRKTTADRGEREPGDAEPLRDGSTDDPDRNGPTAGRNHARSTTDTADGSTTDTADETVARDCLVGPVLY